MENTHISAKTHSSNDSKLNSSITSNGKQNNQVGNVILYGIPIVSLVIENQERLCLAQISNTLLKQFSYNEIHNRRVALGITCVQCTPVQLEILRRAGAMPVSSRRCGMITRREAERLCKSFLGDNAPPRLPEDFAFSVHHECAWGCRGAFLPSRYNSSRAKCIKCSYCGLFFSPNKFIFHSHRTGPSDKYVQPDAANFNSWRRHMKLSGTPPEEIVHAWEDVKAMFNGGTRKRLLSSSNSNSSSSSSSRSPKQAKIPSRPPTPSTFTIPTNPVVPAPARVPPFPELPPLPPGISRSLVMDYVWHHNQTAKQFPFTPYSTLPWLKRNTAPLLFPSESSLLGFHSAAAAATALDKPIPPYHHQSAFRPVQSVVLPSTVQPETPPPSKTELSDDEVDIETTDDKTIIVGSIPSGSESPSSRWSPKHETLNNMIGDVQTIATTPLSEAKILRSAISTANSPLNLSPKSDMSSPTSLLNHPSASNSGGGVATSSQSSSSTAMMADRLWSISRITQQISSSSINSSSTAATTTSAIERIPLSSSPTMGPLQFYRQHQDALTHRTSQLQVNIADGSTTLSRSNSPITLKPLDCSACQNVSSYSTTNNNNQISSPADKLTS